MKSSDNSQGFFCIPFFNFELAQRIKKWDTKKVFQSQIEKSFSFPLRSSFWNLRSKIQFKKASHSHYSKHSGITKLIQNKKALHL
jgi:hypothetical protein